MDFDHHFIESKIEFNLYLNGPGNMAHPLVGAGNVLTEQVLLNRICIGFSRILLVNEKLTCKTFFF